MNLQLNWDNPHEFSAKLRQLPALTNQAVEEAIGDLLIDKYIPGAPLLITFAFVDWEKPSNFYLFGRSKKLEELSSQPLNRIMLRDRSNQWYLRGVDGVGNSPTQVVDRLNYIIAAMMPSQVWCIGESMGGFAAIMYGILLNASRIVSFGSLSTFSPSFASQYRDLRWHSIMKRLGEDPISITTDLPTLAHHYGFDNPLHIVVGTSAGAQAPESINLDVMHSQRFAGLSSVHYHYYPEGEHAVTAWLASNRQFDALLMRCLFDVPDSNHMQSRAPSKSTIKKLSSIGWSNTATSLDVTNPTMPTEHCGYVIHPIKLGAPVLICFSETDEVTGLSVDFVEERLQLEYAFEQPLNQIVLRDQHQAFLRGCGDLGSDIQSVTNNLRNMVDSMQAQRIICIGKGLGGFAALLFGSFLNADSILTFDPVSLLDVSLAKCWHDKRYQTTLEFLDCQPVADRPNDLLPVLKGFNGQIAIACSAFGQEQGYDVGSHAAVHAQRIATLLNARVYPYPAEGNLISWMRINQVLLEFMGNGIFGLK